MPALGPAAFRKRCSCKVLVPVIISFQLLHTQLQLSNTWAEHSLRNILTSSGIEKNLSQASYTTKPRFWVLEMSRLGRTY